MSMMIKHTLKIKVINLTFLEFEKKIVGIVNRVTEKWSQLSQQIEVEI